MFDKEFYDKLMETHHDVKNILAWNEAHQKQDDARHADIDKRIGSLENSRLKVVGGASVLGAVVALVVKWLFK